MSASRTLAALAGAAVTLVSVRAAHAACAGRPTDAAGFQGYTYGASAVKSYATARTRVHYATSGSHVPDLATSRGDMVPDTVALAGDVAERSLLKYSEMGFKQPQPDGACTSNGGDDKIDIYLVSFAGADGSTVTESCSGRSCASFLLVESSFVGRGYPTVAEGFRTVVAHELFHAVQNGYDSELDRFWAEGTAQWAMKQVFPELVDFERQLPAFFKDNTRSLDTQPSGVTAGFLYGASVWPLFLTLRHGDTVVREILEQQADGTKAIAATDAVLKTKGASVATDYPIFGAFNAATKSLAAEGGYPDAAKYPGVKVVALEDGATGITSGLSYFVYRGTLDAASKLSVETDATRNGAVVVPIVDGVVKLAAAAALPTNAGPGEVLVVVAGTTTKKTDAAFTVRVGAADPNVTPDAGVAPGAGDGDGGGCSVAAGVDSNASVAPLLGLAALILLTRRKSVRKTRA